MAHTSITRARAYAKMKQSRAIWIMQNGPCARCGSWIDPEIDHIDSESKVNHNVWSWSPQRREAELAKCQVLCKTCHGRKTAQENRERQTGKPLFRLRKYTPSMHNEVVRLLASGMSLRSVGKAVKMSHGTLSVRLRRGGLVGGVAPTPATSRNRGRVVQAWDCGSRHEGSIPSGYPS